MTATDLDLTLEICTEDGARTEFYQSDAFGISKLMRLLDTPRLFTQPLLTLSSERSVSILPSRTIDLILARTLAPATLPLPAGWLDAVETSADTFYNEEVWNATANADAEDRPLPAPAEGNISHLEVHTLGDWMIRLKLQTTVPSSVQEQRQFLARFLELPVIPFRLETGGIGFINPPKITRLTVRPTLKEVTEAALPADFLRCIRL